MDLEKKRRTDVADHASDAQRLPCLGGGFKQFLRVPSVTEVHGHSRSHSVPPMGCWRQVHQPTNIACAPQAHVKKPCLLEKLGFDLRWVV